MPIAIITDKYPDGRTRALRSALFPPSKEAQEQAKQFDVYLTKRIPEIERKLEKNGLLVSSRSGKQGSTQLWHALGVELRASADKLGVKGPRERRWLWEAIENLYASEKIVRAGRGKTRNHLEYCYRLSAFPIEFAEQWNWSLWSFFFDSRSVREEPRIDSWLMKKVGPAGEASRSQFRQFTKNLNSRIKKLDTSVLSDAELFRIYDSVWESTERGLKASPRLS